MTQDKRIELVLNAHKDHKQVNRQKTVVLDLHPGDRLLLQELKKSYANLIGMSVTYGDTICWLYHLAQDYLQKQKEEKDKELC